MFHTHTYYAEESDFKMIFLERKMKLLEDGQQNKQSSAGSLEFLMGETRVYFKVRDLVVN